VISRLLLLLCLFFHYLRTFKGFVRKWFGKDVDVHASLNLLRILLDPSRFSGFKNARFERGAKENSSSKLARRCRGTSKIRAPKVSETAREVCRKFLRSQSRLSTIRESEEAKDIRVETEGGCKQSRYCAQFVFLRKKTCKNGCLPFSDTSRHKQVSVFVTYFISRRTEWCFCRLVSLNGRHLYIYVMSCLLLDL